MEYIIYKFINFIYIFIKSIYKIHIYNATQNYNKTFKKVRDSG